MKIQEIGKSKGRFTSGCRAGISKSSSVLQEVGNDIDDHERRMKKLLLVTMKLTHSYVILHPLGDQPGHSRARLGEAWLIRELGLIKHAHEQS